MGQRFLRGVALVCLLVAGLMTVHPVAAQDEDGFTLGASTAFCPPEHFGPYVDCTPWQGVTVTYLIVDTRGTESCVTSGEERVAGCSVVVPYGATVQISIDPSAIPAGYVLNTPVVQEMTVPDGPPEGLYGGASFVLVEVEAAGADEAPPAEVEPVETADSDSSPVTVLPSTGAGTSGERALIPAVLAGVASFLAIGGYGLRHVSRR